jgi:hypothetical protein
MSEEKQANPPVCLGLDCGTMNIVLARSDSDQIKITRNVFLPVDKDAISFNQLSNISYVESDTGELFIIGADAFTFGNIFGTEVCRPMQSGLISPKEIYAIDVLTLMIRDLIGKTKGRDIYCSYSIPAESIDDTKSIIYHENVFAKILNKLGINYTAVNEASAIIYSECSVEKFSGVALSFGAGMVNCSIMFKGVEAHKFSTARSGDWIDKQVAQSLDMIPNRVTNIKEKYMTLDGSEPNVQQKKQKRILEALNYYYKELINYTIKKVIKEFKDRVDVELDDKIPLVLGGGTSIPSGFVTLFRNILMQHELPFEISEVRQAKNPLTAVANGLLIKTMADVKGFKK